MAKQSLKTIQVLEVATIQVGNRISTFMPNVPQDHLEARRALLEAQMLLRRAASKINEAIRSQLYAHGTGKTGHEVARLSDLVNAQMPTEAMISRALTQEELERTAQERSRNDGFDGDAFDIFA